MIEPPNVLRVRRAYPVPVLVIWIIFIGSVIADIAGWRIGLDRKLLYSVLSVEITLTGYAIYLCQMFPVLNEPAVKPQPLTWLLFGLLTSTGAAVQVTQGEGTGSLCLIATAMGCFVIAFWSYKKWESEWRFDWFDKNVAILAMLLFAGSVVSGRSRALTTLSALLATAADVASYVPTIRKGWKRPYEDSITNFFFNGVKCVPALLALNLYSIATAVYLVVLTVMNLGVALFLSIRRRPWLVPRILVAICWALLPPQIIILATTLFAHEIVTSTLHNINSVMDWKIGEFDLWTQVGLLLSNAAFLTAEYHFGSIATEIHVSAEAAESRLESLSANMETSAAEAQRRLVSIAESISSRCIQSFPYHLERIATLVSSATRKVVILADCVDYGSFRDFDRHEKLLLALCAKRMEIDDIQVVIWNHAAALSRANKYRDDDIRAADVSGFCGHVTTFIGNLEQCERDFAFQYSDDIEDVKRAVTHSDSDWRDHDGAPMKSLMKVLLGFHNGVQMKKLAAAGVQPTVFGVDDQTRLSEEEASSPPELFFWIVDNEIAIFILPLHGEDALAFETHERSLIDHLDKIFQKRLDYANKHPSQPR